VLGLVSWPLGQTMRSRDVLQTALPRLSGDAATSVSYFQWLDHLAGQHEMVGRYTKAEATHDEIKPLVILQAQRVLASATTRAGR